MLSLKNLPTNKVLSVNVIVEKQRAKSDQKANICGNIMVFIFSSYSFS
jgi:hypothetical protein